MEQLKSGIQSTFGTFFVVVCFMYLTGIAISTAHRTPEYLPASNPLCSASYSILYLYIYIHTYHLLLTTNKCIFLCKYIYMCVLYSISYNVYIIYNYIYILWHLLQADSINPAAGVPTLPRRARLEAAAPCSRPGRARAKDAAPGAAPGTFKASEDATWVGLKTVRYLLYVIQNVIYIYTVYTLIITFMTKYYCFHYYCCCCCRCCCCLCRRIFYRPTKVGLGVGWGGVVLTFMYMFIHHRL